MKISRATVLELRKSIRSRSRRWLLVAAGVVGLLSAGVVAFTGPVENHTFAVISFYTQIAISLPLPFVSVLLMTQQFGRRMSYVGVGRSLGAIIRCEAAGKRGHCSGRSGLRRPDLVGRD
jgi:hypothetical protein